MKRDEETKNTKSINIRKDMTLLKYLSLRN
jgi:hypothetical protein